MRQSERCDELTHQRACQQQKNETRDDPHPAVRLGDSTRDEKEECAESAEEDGMHRVGCKPLSRRLSARHVAPRRRSSVAEAPPPGGPSISPANSRVRRKRTGPKNSPTVADKAAMTSTVSPTAPGNRSA